MTPLLHAAFACILAVALLQVAARRLEVAPSIVMLVAGGALSFVPGFSSIVLEPDLVLLVLLPPLLYTAGVGLSWRGFRDNLRPILLLAIGCVVFTAVAVAAVCHWLFGLPWAAGMVLGAIVSPPDAVAPLAIARRLGLPERIETVLTGESLVNDATALVLFSFALGWMAGQAFEPAAMAVRFAAILASEIGWGFALGWLVLRLRARMHDAGPETLLALATPFAAFWPPHATGGSGVVAAVVAGLYVSWNGPRFIRPDTRLQGFFVWRTLTATIESLVFLLTGLQASRLLAAQGGGRLGEWLLAGAAITAVVVAVRFVWVFPATYLPRLSRAFAARDPAPTWQTPFFIAFTGLRGVVSLAAALSIPAALPDRDWLLFVTFFVIAATLLGLGGALPAMMRWLGLGEAGAHEAAARKAEEQRVRIAGIDAALARLDVLERAGAPAHSVATLRRRHEDRRRHLVATADPDDARDPVGDTTRLQLELVEAERAALAESHARGAVGDEARRRIERELDLEDARVRHAGTSVSIRGATADGPSA